jgi:hypothetical protein
VVEWAADVAPDEVAADVGAFMGNGLAPPATLTTRALNRATLARQHLLERSASDPVELVEQLVGLQAQNPLDPYVALWSRVVAFDPQVVADAIQERRLVRMVVMRGTIHLVTATDAAELRPLVQPVLDAELRRHRDHAPHLDGVDIGPVLDFAATRLATEPATTNDLRAALRDEFPAVDASAAAYACRCLLPLVQVPPRGLWGRSGAVRLTTLDAWVGQRRPPGAAIDDMVLRYIRAFGPSTVADISTWSGLPGMREVVERIRPALIAFRDERGREVVDLEDAPRPDPDEPAPVRFLPEYDNVLLAHQDRTRFGPGPHGFHLHKGTVLVDGEVRSLWHHDKGGDLVVEADRLRRADRDDVDREATGLASLLNAGRVRLATADAAPPPAARPDGASSRRRG